MNHLKHYVKLIRKAENRTLQGCVEKHHTFPKSIFGDNNRLVSLTPKEHYIAHALLEKALIKRYGINDPKAYKMVRAFFIMNNMSKHRSSKLYEQNKIRYIGGIKGVPRSPEVIEKMSKPKHSEHGKRVSEGRKGIKFSDEHKKKLSEAHKTRTHYAKGHKFTLEHKEKLSIAAKNKPPVSDETKQKLALKSKESWAKRKALKETTIVF